MAGNARAEERESRPGRHRRGSSGTSWTPSIPRSRGGASHLRAADGAEDDTVPLPRIRSTEPTGPIRIPTEAMRYAWPETPATGLRKFNLGTIPASVTPPRTWRRAAWFAVGTATVVCVALGYAAVTLVGNPRKGGMIEALPGQPSQQLLITDLPADEPTRAAPTTSVRTTTRPPSATRTTTSTTRRRDAGYQASPQTPLSGRPAPTTSPGRPAVPQPSRTPDPPTRTTVEAAALSPTDPDTMGDVTEQYYANVLDDPAAAYALTTGSMRAGGPEGIKARYADIERIEVREIVIDPNWSFTRSVLVYVRKDGSTVTVRRELTFSSGANPRITGDTETP